ncbi:DUF1129 family protein [Metabacillus halosaccharovorans]|uniref:DUF1129 family protein n=1 Tax=Metabacillus halosaccharovorans TaxID=930124 RepID=UPI001C1F85DA|nr:DUF1129 family protein [Metabacillus halosaccharovorans]MBU7592561.1 DUF1129 domain-containing protein [Metabacillus halosaccharovorans]
MRSAKQLIKENNEKRELLTAENKQLYEDFLIYMRTELRIAEYESEELLMDILDHLLEAQEDGKDATTLFGSKPKEYAEELIASLPEEKKRYVFPFVISQVFNLLGLFCFIYGLGQLILPYFIEIPQSISLGNSIGLIMIILAMTYFGIIVFFKLIRSTLFTQNKKKTRHTMWKAGLLGGGSFAIIMLLTWILPDFGPEVQVEWWVYFISGFILVVLSKVIGRVNNQARLVN